MAEVRIAITRVVQWGGELTRSNKLGTKNGQVSLVNYTECTVHYNYRTNTFSARSGTLDQ